MDVINAHTSFTVGALPEGTGLRNPEAEILKITKNLKERRVTAIMAFRRESGRWNTDVPYGPSVRTVRTDRPYGRSVWKSQSTSKEFISCKVSVVRICSRFERPCIFQRIFIFVD